jgi:4a-hydroxytetrahydrobiopterin dehydratase
VTTASGCDLAAKRCVPCEGGVPRLTAEECARLHAQVPAWSLQASDRLRRRFTFRNFVALMAFVNRMAELAESEGHHPDFSVHYNKLDVELFTHAIGGLSENDFILAAKIDALARG